MIQAMHLCIEAPPRAGSSCDLLIPGDTTNQNTVNYHHNNGVLSDKTVGVYVLLVLTSCTCMICEMKSVAFIMQTLSDRQYVFVI